jgi:hypothetical protein
MSGYNALEVLTEYFRSEWGSMDLGKYVKVGDYIRDGELDIIRLAGEPIFSKELITIDKDLENKLKKDPPFDIIRYLFERWDNLFQEKIKEIYPNIGSINLQNSLANFLKTAAPHVYYDGDLQCYVWNDGWKEKIEPMEIHHQPNSIFDLYRFYRMKMYWRFFLGYEIFLYKNNLDEIDKTAPVYPLSNTGINALPYLSIRIRVNDIVDHKKTKDLIVSVNGIPCNIFKNQRHVFYYLFIIRNLPRNKLEELPNGEKVKKITTDKWISISCSYEKIGEEFLRDIFTALDGMINKSESEEYTNYYWCPENVDFFTESIPNREKNSKTSFDTIDIKGIFDFDKLLAHIINGRLKDATKADIETNLNGKVKKPFQEKEIKDVNGNSTGEIVKKPTEISLDAPIGDSGDTRVDRLEDKSRNDFANLRVSTEWALDFLVKITNDKFKEKFCELLWKCIIESIKNEILSYRIYPSDRICPSEKELERAFLFDEIVKFLKKGSHVTNSIVYKVLKNIYNSSECLAQTSCANRKTCKKIMDKKNKQDQNTCLTLKIRKEIWRSILLDPMIMRTANKIRTALNNSREDPDSSIEVFKNRLKEFKKMEIIIKKGYEDYIEVLEMQKREKIKRQLKNNMKQGDKK